MSFTNNIVVRLAVVWLLKGCFVVPVTSSGALYDCVLHIIHKHFPGECVCFFVPAATRSRVFDELIAEVSQIKSVYVVSPEDGEQQDEVDVGRKTKPLKPFPCYFVIDLPYVGTDTAGRFLKRGYHHSGGNLNESRYLVVAGEQHSRQQAATLLQIMFSYGFLDVDLVNPTSSQIEISTIFPFGRNLLDCPERTQPTVETVAIWKNGSLQQKMELFPQKLPTGGFAGCSWNISSPYFVPYLIVDNAGQHTGPLTGYDGGPMSLLMNRLNLTPEWTVDFENLWIKTYENGTVLGAIPNLLLGRGAQMCCGGLYQSSWAYGNVDPTHFYTWAKVSWFVAAPDKVPKWTMIFAALNGPVWAAVIATSTTIPIIYWVLCILSKRFISLANVFLTLIALLFSNSTGTAPVNITLRVIFISWLFYTLHIDQFYLASLTRLITTADYEPMIKTVDQLLASKLPTAAFMYTAITLRNAENPSILKLMENHVPIPTLLNESLITMSLYKNISIADNQLFVRYTVAIMKNVSVYRTRVNYQERVMGALMWRHNYLFDRINWLLLRMYDAGFPVYFLQQTVPDRFWSNPVGNPARAFNLRDLSGPFYILLIGLLLSFLSFLGELAHLNPSRLFGNRKNRRHLE